VSFISLNKTGLNNNGKEVDFYYLSITLYTSIIFIVDMKIAIYTKYWTILTPISLILLSLVLYFAYMFGIDLVTDEMIAQTTHMLFTSCHFYLIVLMNFGVIFLLDLGYRYIKSTYYGDLADYYQKLIKTGKHQNEALFNRLVKSKSPEKEIQLINITNGDEEKNKSPAINSARGEDKSFQQMESVDYLLKGQEQDGITVVGRYNQSPKEEVEGEGSKVSTDKMSDMKRRRNKPIPIQSTRVDLKEKK